MTKHYENHEFEALRCLYEEQTALLRWMNLLDYWVLGAYIALQMVFGAWVAICRPGIYEFGVTAGLMTIDFALILIAISLLHGNEKRRAAVVRTIGKCCNALGYAEPDIYLEGRPLSVETDYRPTDQWYYLPMIAAFIGVALVLFTPLW